MYRIRVMVVLIIALTAGGSLAYGTYNFLQNAPVRNVPVPAATQPVVVAAADLEAGSELRADDLRTVDWPQGSVPDGAYADPRELVGRALITPAVRNEAILTAKLGTGAGLPPTIPPGMRAVSVPVNEVVGVAGYVLPGTHVDVLATTNPSGRIPDVTTRVVLTNVTVLTAGTRMEQRQTQPVQVAVVTLLVTPEQAERLTLAATEGKIHLALRNPLDKGTPETPGVRQDSLGRMRGNQPARTRGRRTYTTRPAVIEAATVDAIRGDKRVQEPVK